MTRYIVFFAAALLLCVGWSFYQPTAKCHGITYRMDYEKHAITHCVAGKWELVK